MTRFLVRFALGAWLVSGCGPLGAGPGPVSTRQTASSGLRLATHYRPAGTAIELSLWVDSGSRDAAPPQLASVTAWNAAQTRARVDVFPDGTRFTVPCETARVETCISLLRSILCDPPAPNLPPAERQLSRARAQQAQGLRPSELEAAKALLGDAASSFFPLGNESHDSALTESKIQAFFRDHYGPSRALLLAVGDVSMEQLASTANSAFRGCSEARLPRRSNSLELHSTVRTSSGNPPTATVAAATSTFEQANGLQRSVLDAVPGVSLRSFPVRGGVIVLATSDHLERDLEVILQTMTFAPIRETPQLETPEILGHTFLSVSRRQNGQTPPRTVAMAVVGQSEVPDRARYERLLESTREPPAPTITQSGRLTTLQLPNARRLVVEHTSHSASLLALRFEPGAAGEALPDHGSTALLAELLKTHCSSQLGTQLETHVGAGAWGIIGEFSPEEAPSRAYDLLQCARTASVDGESLLRAKARLFRSYTDAETAAALALPLLTADRPGAAAPRGNPETVMSLAARSVREALATARTPISVHVMGHEPHDVEQLRPRWAEVLAGLGRPPQPRNAAPPPAVTHARGAGEAPTQRSTAAPEGFRSNAIVHFVVPRSEAEHVAEAGAVAFSGALIERLNHTDQVSFEVIEARLSGIEDEQIRVTLLAHGSDQGVSQLPSLITEVARQLQDPAADTLQELVSRLQILRSAPRRRILRLKDASQSDQEAPQDALGTFDRFRRATPRVTFLLRP